MPLDIETEIEELKDENEWLKEQVKQRDLKLQTALIKLNAIRAIMEPAK